MRGAASGVESREALMRAGKIGALTTFIQGALYAALVAGLLFLIVRAYGAPFDPQYQATALLGGAFSFLLLGRFDLLAAWRMGRPGSVGTQVLYSWMIVVGLLLFIAYVSQYTGYFSRVILTAWFVMTPAALALLNAVTRGFTQRFVPHALAQRSAVIVFANESGQMLARSLHESELYRLEGYFDDRADGSSRGEAFGRRLGGVDALVDHVRTHATDVVFILLPEHGIGRAIELQDLLGDTTASVYFVPNFALYDLIGADSLKRNQVDKSSTT